jgi:hypothetical protein
MKRFIQYIQFKLDVFFNCPKHLKPFIGFPQKATESDIEWAHTVVQKRKDK